METKSIVHAGKLTASRRKFIERVGLASVLSTFGAAFFTSCVSEGDSNPDGTTAPPVSGNGITVSGSTVEINLTIQSSLSRPGGWLLINSAKTLVANINGAYVAMTSVCTHSGCADSWSFSNSRFTCTCHSSIFDSSGAVLQGPATVPLQVYTTSVSGTTLTISK